MTGKPDVPPVLDYARPTPVDRQATPFYIRIIGFIFSMPAMILGAVILFFCLVFMRRPVNEDQLRGLESGIVILIVGVAGVRAWLRFKRRS